MSKIEVDAIEPQSGTTLTIGASGDSVNIASGATITDFTSTGIDDNATSTAITIDSSENIGIGTVSPADTLNIGVGTKFRATHSASVYQQIYSTASGNFIKAFGDNLAIDSVAGALYLSTLASQPMVFQTNNTEAMRITSTGSLGIGTTAPSAKLSVSGANSDTYGQLNVVSTGAGADAQISFSTPTNGRGMYLDDSATNAFKIYSGFGKGGGGEFVIDNSGNVTINGSLSKSSGSFRIPHPIKPETHQLVHSFVEAPQADNIYRGKVELVDGRAEVNIDTVASMTEGTFVALNREVQCFTSNESDWDAVRGSVTGNILTIECQNAESTATISWLVIGERQDQHMYDTDWTDENGKVIVEPLKETEE